MDAVGQLLEGEITGVAVLADAFAGVFADIVHGSSFLRCQVCKYWEITGFLKRNFLMAAL